MEVISNVILQILNHLSYILVKGDIWHEPNSWVLVDSVLRADFGLDTNVALEGTLMSAGLGSTFGLSPCTRLYSSSCLWFSPQTRKLLHVPCIFQYHVDHPLLNGGPWVMWPLWDITQRPPPNSITFI
jgi:hypothetical protein